MRDVRRSLLPVLFFRTVEPVAGSERASVGAHQVSGHIPVGRVHRVHDDALRPFTIG